MEEHMADNHNVIEGFKQRRAFPGKPTRTPSPYFYPPECSTQKLGKPPTLKKCCLKYTLNKGEPWRAALNIAEPLRASLTQSLAIAGSP